MTTQRRVGNQRRRVLDGKTRQRPGHRLAVVMAFVAAAGGRQVQSHSIRRVGAVLCLSVLVGSDQARNG